MSGFTDENDDPSVNVAIVDLISDAPPLQAPCNHHVHIVRLSS